MLHAADFTEGHWGPHAGDPAVRQVLVIWEFLFQKKKAAHRQAAVKKNK